MTTTDTKTEYVTDVEHEKDCRLKGDRDALFIDRIVHETQPAYFDSPDGEDLIWAGDEWTFEEFMEPHRLRCSGCDGFMYVHLTEDGAVIRLTRDNCPRYGRAYGHFTNYDRKPCEYCGYAGKGGAL